MHFAINKPHERMGKILFKLLLQDIKSLNYKLKPSLKPCIKLILHTR